MLFSSFEFIFGFMPAVALLYWLLRKHGSTLTSNLFLVAASYLFYVSGEHTYRWLIVLSIALNYLIAAAMDGSTDARRKAWLVAGLAADLAALVYFKYSGLIASSLAALGWVGRPTIDVTLPIGVSFFTFTQIAYLVDVYGRKAKVSDPVGYGLFVTFFPHLIAGPIIHHSEMMPQFTRSGAGRKAEFLAGGLSMFAIGLFKKTVIADSVAPIASGLFGRVEAGEHLSLMFAWAAGLSYACQIYFDFSGYSDMAIGLAKMLGIDLPINFNSPYKSESISDFWRRWHITLSRFLRDYLYIPLGGNRRGAGRRYVNLLVTMLLGGLWHGAGWTFLVWGGLHGTYLVIEGAWRALREKLRVPALPGLAARAFTLAAVVFAWVPFRAPNLQSTASIWRGMVGLGGTAGTAVPVSTLELGAVAGLFLATIMLPNSQQIARIFKPGLDSPGYHVFAAPGPRTALGLNVRSALLVGLILGLGLRAISGYSEFIYFQF